MTQRIICLIYFFFLPATPVNLRVDEGVGEFGLVGLDNCFPLTLGADVVDAGALDFTGSFFLTKDAHVVGAALTLG